MAKGQHFPTVADEVQWLRSVVALQVKMLDAADAKLTAAWQRIAELKRDSVPSSPFPQQL